MRQVDARGLSCPQPVIHTKKALDALDDGEIITIVDNLPARDNLIKLAQSLRCDVDVEEHGQEYHVHIKKGNITDLPTELESDRTRLAYFIGANVMGRGSDELGNVLIKSFFYTLTQSDNLPQVIAMVNSGVFLACEDSPVLEHLLELERKGVEILACGTCLDFFKKKEKICVGSISNMYTILERITAMDKTISI